MQITTTQRQIQIETNGDRMRTRRAISILLISLVLIAVVAILFDVYGSLGQRFGYTVTRSAFKSISESTTESARIGLYFSGFSAYTYFFSAIGAWLAAALTFILIWIQLKQIEEQRIHRLASEKRFNEELEKRNEESKSEKINNEIKEIFFFLELYESKFNLVSIDKRFGEHSIPVLVRQISDWIESLDFEQATQNDFPISDQNIRAIAVAGSILETQRRQAYEYEDESLNIAIEVYSSIHSTRILTLAELIRRETHLRYESRISLESRQAVDKLQRATEPFRHFLEDIRTWESQRLDFRQEIELP